MDGAQTGPRFDLCVYILTPDTPDLAGCLADTLRDGPIG
jgi:hypothetical protein